MFDPDQILFAHTCKTLPDSMVERRLVLQALKVKLSKKHPAHANVSSQLSALDVIEDLQSKLQFKRDAK